MAVTSLLGRTGTHSLGLPCLVRLPRCPQPPESAAAGGRGRPAALPSRPPTPRFRRPGRRRGPLPFTPRPSCGGNAEFSPADARSPRVLAGSCESPLLGASRRPQAPCPRRARKGTPSACPAPRTEADARAPRAGSKRPTRPFPRRAPAAAWTAFPARCPPPPAAAPTAAPRRPAAGGGGLPPSGPEGPAGYGSSPAAFKSPPSAAPTAAPGLRSPPASPVPGSGEPLSPPPPGSPLPGLAKWASTQRCAPRSRRRARYCRGRRPSRRRSRFIARPPRGAFP